MPTFAFYKNGEKVSLAFGFVRNRGPYMSARFTEFIKQVGEKR